MSYIEFQMAAIHFHSKLGLHVFITLMKSLMLPLRLLVYYLQNKKSTWCRSAQKLNTTLDGTLRIITRCLKPSRTESISVYLRHHMTQATS